jgi:hypothetical protein
MPDRKTITATLTPDPVIIAEYLRWLVRETRLARRLLRVSVDARGQEPVCVPLCEQEEALSRG